LAGVVYRALVDATDAWTLVVWLAIQLTSRDAQDGSTLVKNAALRRPATRDIDS
jgi:hypothetical protein